MEPSRFVHPDDPKPASLPAMRAQKAAVRAGVVIAPPRDELDRVIPVVHDDPPLVEIVEATIEDISEAVSSLHRVPVPSEPMRSAGELAQDAMAAYEDEVSETFDPLTVGENVAPLTVGENVAPLTVGENVTSEPLGGFAYLEEEKAPPPADEPPPVDAQVEAAIEAVMAVEAHPPIVEGEQTP